MERSPFDTLLQLVAVMTATMVLLTGVGTAVASRLADQTAGAAPDLALAIAVDRCEIAISALVDRAQARPDVDPELQGAFDAMAATVAALRHGQGSAPDLAQLRRDVAAVTAHLDMGDGSGTAGPLMIAVAQTATSTQTGC